MVQTIQQLRLVVASPGDVQAEREIVTAVAAKIDHADLGVHLRVVRWETDSYPGFHPEGPQALIDPLLSIADADIVIGIFWKRFGKQTKSGETGTEHEINTAIEAWKKNKSPHIMLYFSTQAYAPKSKKETDQWGAVLAFKEKLEEDGQALFWNYADPSEFRKFLDEHLELYLKKQYGKKASDTTQAPAPVQAPSRHDWHPPSDAGKRGELSPCWFSLNSNFKTDGEGRWNKWGDLLVNLENAQNSDYVYLLPSRKSPQRLHEWKKLSQPQNIAEKKKIGEDFAKKFAGKRLPGFWFFKHIKAQNKERVQVYSPDYDDFLNAAANEPKTETQA
jgi:hypothetical protein